MRRIRNGGAQHESCTSGAGAQGGEGGARVSEGSDGVLKMNQHSLHGVVSHCAQRVCCSACNIGS